VPRATLPATLAAEAFPGPGPWDATAWTGAALYLLLFLAALAGAWRLARGSDAGEGP
jgi:hypothetical protein